MALANLAGWTEDKAASACGAACGASDKPVKTPAACGSACGAEAALPLPEGQTEIFTLLTPGVGRR